MAQIITICSNKGGCGKTTTAINLGAALRLSGFDVLLADMDGQRNLTAAIRADAGEGTIYTAMIEEVPTYIKPYRAEGRTEGSGVLDVLPSEADLSALDVYLADKTDRLSHFQKFIDLYRDKYDIIIVDTPPANGLITISTLVASDAAVLPIVPEYFAMQGYIQTEDTIRKVEEYNGRKMQTRAVITQYDARKTLHRISVGNIRKDIRPLFSTIIRTNSTLAEAEAMGRSIFAYSPKSNGAKDYKALADEFAEWRRLRHMKHGNR